MNDDIRTRLDQVVGDAMQDATPTEPLRRAAIESVRARRRRRPAVVVGAVLAGLTLVGTGAYAIHLATAPADQVVLPDRIGPGLTPPGATAPTDDEPPQDEAPQDDAAPDDAPNALSPADPAATFPQCGTVVEASQEQFSLWGGRPPTASGIDLLVHNATGEHVTGTRSDAALALVRDGVVVGVSTAADITAVPFELGPTFPMDTLNYVAPVTYSSCVPGAGALPAGHYAAWGAQELAIAERAPLVDTGPLGEDILGTPVMVDEQLTVRGKVADLWIDDTGQPVFAPDATAGWPVPVDQMTAFAGQAGPRTVVWLASQLDAPAGALTSQEEILLSLGYLEGTIPFRCQLAAAGQLGVTDDGSGDGMGVGVIFASRAEADAFVALYEPLHGPVAGVVEGEVFCGE